MKEESRKTGGNGSSTVPDETLRLYLLCLLDEGERLKLDERLLVDDELAERMRLAESELIDDYAAGKLEPAERNLFARSFLVTEARQRGLRFSTSLRDYAGSQIAPAAVPRPAKHAWGGGLLGLFEFNWPRTWKLAGSFAALLLLAGLIWFAAKESRETQPAIVRNEPPPTFSPQAATSPQVVKPGPEPTSKTPPPVPTSSEPAMPPPVIASFVLLPGAVRGSGDLPRIALPDGERDILHLTLVLESNDGGSYRAELATAEGQSVFARGNLMPVTGKAETKIALNIPARLLQNGDYQIKLTHKNTDGQSETVGRYYFRALD